MSKETDLKDTIEEQLDKVNSYEPTSEDSAAKHNIFSRLMILTTIGIFIYTFAAPLPIGYATIMAYIFFGVFASIVFGINALKIVSDLIKTLKGK